MIVFTSKNLSIPSIEFAEDCVEKYCAITRKSKKAPTVLSKRPKVLKDEMGKPYIDGELYLSISHTSATLNGAHNIIAVAVSTKKAGVDIEVSRRIDWKKIANRYFTPEEIKTIKTSRDFFYLWTRKEALFKAMKDQRGVFMPKIDTLSSNFLKTYDIYENVILSIYSEDQNIYFNA